MDTLAQGAAAMREVLTTTANALARSTGFVQRTSKLTGASFVQALMFACMATPMPTCISLPKTFFWAAKDTGAAVARF